MLWFFDENYYESLNYLISILIITLLSSWVIDASLYAVSIFDKYIVPSSQWSVLLIFYVSHRPTRLLKNAAFEIEHISTC